MDEIKPVNEQTSSDDDEEELKKKKKAKEDEEKKKMEQEKTKETIASRDLKLNVDVDIKKLDETISKLKEIDSLKEKISKAEIVTKPAEIKEEKKPSFKGKVSIAEGKNKEAETNQFVCEHSGLGDGYMLYKMPASDGRLI